ncbi:hypothetical protein FEM48_Zijuj07G0118500 [Ziziphus jujuba var. spinosa]|uniref:NADP-dependent oxidoreductase domain-containing protein n=1 Tax=Ziziphus jujuba var. spinosa TaxID=714518 RepID=A0A978V4G7_ZIZJJ|nr:hypothetical protein FEM48_Zijuj07G0118500 [Ziziphus jujuba var. spinosa]
MNFPSSRALGIGITMHPSFSKKNLVKNKPLYSKLANLAEKHGCTTHQLALAWLLHQGNDKIPIPGTTTVKNLADNIGALALKLTEGDLKETSDDLKFSLNMSGSLEIPH